MATFVSPYPKGRPDWWTREWPPLHSYCRCGRQIYWVQDVDGSRFLVGQDGSRYCPAVE